MGDDLIFAQKFTRTAADGLALLVEMEDPRSADDAAVVIDMMTTVQRGAKRLHARHIYSGAQGVLSALHHETDGVLKGRIENLGHLVTHYARGLNDLQTPAAKSKPPLEAWTMARETLNELLPIADMGDADILSRLMRAPVTLETVQPNQVIPFTRPEAADNLGQVDTAVIIEAPLADDAPAMEITPLDITPIESEPVESERVESTSVESPNALDMPSSASAEPEPSVALDAMMRDVIADALSVARVVGRTISLSYDMGDRTISHSQAENLSGRLGQALSQIIRESLSEDRVGHIDINLAGEQLHIIAGTTAMRVAITPKTAVETASAPEVKPLITPETEQGLRAQLRSLMDPRSLHETAS